MKNKPGIWGLECSSFSIFTLQSWARYLTSLGLFLWKLKHPNFIIFMSYSFLKLSLLITKLFTMKVNDDLETPSLKLLLWDHRPTFWGHGEQKMILVYWFDFGISKNKNNFIHFHLHMLTCEDWFVESGKWQMSLNRKCYWFMSQGYYLTKMLSELFQKLSWRESIHYVLFMMLLKTSWEVQILATYTHSFRHFPILVPCLLYRENFYPSW